jgi:hypothetical protein
MREPPLACGTQPESYRLLWMHSFSETPRDGVSHYPPTMVRFSKMPDGWRATAVRLAGSINRQEIYRHERMLTPDDGQELLRAIDTFGLWSRHDFAFDARVFDGANWLIEGRRGTAYHPVVLWNADRAAVQRLARVFARLAGIDKGTMVPTNSDLGLE